MQPSTFFQLVSDPTEKMKILYDLAEGKRDIICKSIDTKASIFISEAVTVIGSYLMVRPKKLGVVNFNDESLIIQFQLGNQKYISQVEFKQSDDLIALSMARKLFRVQRREFYRIRMPNNYRGTFAIENIEKTNIQRAFQLIDLSGGGCKIEVPPVDVEIKAGIPFQGTLRIPNRGEFPMKCIVRHQNVITGQGKPDVRWIGVQFIEQTEADSNRLAALVMDLHREFFARI